MTHATTTILAALGFGALPLTAACNPAVGVQASHVLGNAPDERDFDRLLQRDLDVYFSTSGVSAAKTEFDFLRRGATQSGVAYPKYYLWVRVYSGSALEAEGAVRVAAIDGERFEVTDFLSKAEIASAPDRVGAIFPAPLVADIQERAAGR